MKKTNSFLTYVLSLGAIAALSQVSALSQTNAAPSNPPAQAEEESRFQKGEMDLAPFGAYVDKAGGKWGAGAALTYYVTDKIGVGGATYWTETKGTFFHNAEAEGYFRLPLLKRLAPYAVASVGYQFDRQYWFETIGAGGRFSAFQAYQRLRRCSVPHREQRHPQWSLPSAGRAVFLPLSRRS